MIRSDPQVFVYVISSSSGTARFGSSQSGTVGNSPITYELDGRQYLLMGGGSALYAWALP